METQKETVLVTGSSGLIGSAIVERLAGRYHVVGFDVVPPKPPAPVEFLKVDLTADASVAGSLEQVRQRHGDRTASVIHLAAFYDFSGEPSPKYEEITVRGTQRLLRELKRFTVEQFVFSSTMLVHAPCEPGQQINEDWPLEPKWPYPESKVRTEELLRAEHGEIPLLILRMAGVYDDRGHSIPIAHQIQRINERTPTSRLFSGDITHGQPYLHLEDLVDALERAVERRRELPAEATLLLGEPETMSYDELQRELGHLIHGAEGEEWCTLEVPKPLAKAGTWLQDLLPGQEPFIKPWMIDIADDHYALDITRARTLLGWEPKHSLRETLPKVVAALKADPQQWYQANKLEPPSPRQAAGAAVTGKEWAFLIGGIGVGGALMYLLDPDRGRRRRAYLRDQAVHAAHVVGDSVAPGASSIARDLGKRARNLSNHVRGAAVEASARLRDEEVPDEVLVARVRSEMGHVTHHAQEINVRADTGRVTLSGVVRAGEVKRLLASVAHVRGVRDVENRLEVLA
jgi:nucleoside-diphosphate-sugar epimerase/osmotically-inducible protein OsmY